MAVSVIDTAILLYRGVKMSRKLDTAIAEALGYKVVNGWAEKVENDLLDRKEIPKYSTDGNDMLELDREMRVRNYVLFMNRGPDGAVIAYYNKPTNGAINQSELLARALATYKALTGKEWRE